MALISGTPSQLHLFERPVHISFGLSLRIFQRANFNFQISCKRWKGGKEWKSTFPKTNFVKDAENVASKMYFLSFPPSVALSLFLTCTHANSFFFLLNFNTHSVSIFNIDYNQCDQIWRFVGLWATF